MFEAAAATASVNILLLLIVSGYDIGSGTAAGVLGIFMPFTDELVILWFEFAANIILSFAVQFLLIKRMEQLWTMLCFYMRCGSRKKLFLNQKKNLYVLLGCIAAAKIITDLIWHFAFEVHLPAKTLVYIEVSFLLSCVLWLELVYFLFAAGLKSMYSMFAALAASCVSLLAVKFSKLSFFAYAQIKSSAEDIVIKLVLICAFAVIGAVLIMKRDLLET